MKIPACLPVGKLQIGAPEWLYKLINVMFEQYEKKINKILLNFIIWGSYMGDYGQQFAERIRTFVIDAYHHLLEQWGKVKAWYRD